MLISALHSLSVYVSHKMLVIAADECISNLIRSRNFRFLHLTPSKQYARISNLIGSRNFYSYHADKSRFGVLEYPLSLQPSSSVWFESSSSVEADCADDASS
jgi:hypothetical protein